MALVYIAVAPEDGGGPGGSLRALDDSGAPAGTVETVPDLAAAVAARERVTRPPRWVWADTALVYPPLLRVGVRVARCLDLALTEALLLAREGSFGLPRGLDAAWARLHGLTVSAARPAGPAHRSGNGGFEPQPALFEPERALPGGVHPLTAVAELAADQLARIADGPRPGDFHLLVAAESAGALAAAEMGHHGLPWDAAAHDALLTELLGPRPVGGGRPARLAELAARICAALGTSVNPDSPARLVKALRAAGVPVRTTRSSELRRVDHPVVPLLLEYKELARLHAAHGWAWLDAWVRRGRFHPEYVVGGVVSGRWATRGGGALQIPRAVRRAVVADPGHKLVVADAAQLEPRVLAALADDRGLAAAAAEGDLYAALAPAFDGDRAAAKIALLAAMYGQTGGSAGRLLAVLRRRFAPAIEYVEAAARAGEQGRVVSSRLGRVCPPPSAAWARQVTEPDGGAGTRARGRFTRNFVVQATAAEWALILVAEVRRRLAPLGDAAHLVFFQHDEVMVHCRAGRADEVAVVVAEAAAEAGRLVFGATTVAFPLDIHVVDCYSEAK